MKTRSLAAKLFPPSVLEVMKNIYGIHMNGYGHQSFSQEGEDLVLNRIFGERRTGFYVDVGAHHPVRFSNTYLFYKRGWRGINIEPNLSGIRLFNRYRSSDINLALGISNEPGELTYWMFDEPALNSFDSALSEKMIAETKYKLIGTKKIEVVRLANVLAEHAQPGVLIDFMTIDAEGHDLSVLKSNDWERFRPRWVLVESIMPTPSYTIESEQHQFMVSKQYVLGAKTLNTLFYLDLRA